MTERAITKEEVLSFEELQTDFLSLRVGEKIPRLEIKRIRKVVNASKQDNLSGVDFKYIIETMDNKVLTVNTWILWKKITRALREAGKIEAVLELSHIGHEEYFVRVV